MYICYDCHETFERCASETEPHGEVLSCCQVCGSTEIEEAVYCKICGKPMCEDEMTEGICDDCIAAAIYYDTFRAFALDGASDTECSLLEEFVYCWLFGLDYTDAPNGSHEELRKLLVGYYDQRVSEERSLIRDFPTIPARLLDAIRDYIKRYYDEFAEWLAIKLRKEDKQHA